MSVVYGNLKDMNIPVFTMVILALLIGGVVGALVMRIIMRAKLRADELSAEADRSQEIGELRENAQNAKSEQYRAQSEAAQARQELAQLRLEVTTAHKDKAEASQQVAEAHAAAQQARAEKAQVEAKLSAAIAQRDSAIERAEQLNKDRESLVLQFKNLSIEALEKQSKQADETAAKRLEATKEAMAPVQQRLLELNARINEVEKARSEQTAALREQVQAVTTTSENLRRETNALSTALRKPQVRGQWGELQLKRVVEIAGMVDHVSFLTQASDVTSSDTRVRPDMKVMMGEDKYIFVDSKVPLAAYLDALELTDEAERAARMRQFGEHVKTHIDQLSSKKYWTVDSHSPEFVVLFLPSEALAAEAYAQRPDLLEYANAKNVVLASPTTLIGLLRSISYGWKQASLAESSAKLFEIGRELYERLATMGDNFNKLGRALQTSVTSYNQALGSLESRVLVSARRFRDFQISDKELAELKAVEHSTRPVAAPELMAAAASGDQESAAITEGEVIDAGPEALLPAPQ